MDRSILRAILRGYIYPLPLIVLEGMEQSPPPVVILMRKTTISVSRAEKNALDEAKLELYDTKEVPYGAVIYELAGRVTDNRP